MYFLVALNMLLLGIAALLIWRAKRIPLGHARCRHCGYDVQVNPDRCPECGTLDPYDPRSFENRAITLRATAGVLIAIAILLDIPYLILIITT